MRAKVLSYDEFVRRLQIEFGLASVLPEDTASALHFDTLQMYRLLLFLEELLPNGSLISTDVALLHIEDLYTRYAVEAAANGVSGGG